MKTILTGLCSLALLAMILGTAWIIGPANAQTGNMNRPSNVVSTTPVPVKPKKHPLDKGDFKVGFSPKTKAKDPKKVMPKELIGAFQEITNALNQLIAMPKDVYINMDACGEPNAYYNPNASEITFCYELLEQYEAEFKTIEKDQAKVDEMVEDTLIQTLFHELGHCLIDVWELPATGREEDAVDQLATILMLDGSDEGQASTINAALEFEIASRDQEPGDMLFWDEHSFSKTRFYDMLCLVYGSNPDKNEFMIGDDGLPEKRAVRCEEEFKRAERSWMKLLAPYLIQ
ncbi:MAG: hypothetical protein KA956_08795 [Pyrinomonadaceae bacterium]|nr:hypothetical protein [Acidobacteriota bacterium]MBK7935362.1 hypothetical protein [Acidobacteriota bacterium]MBP7376563.1 hypothetical protein [Pyrinomonadaceae bacterium]